MLLNLQSATERLPKHRHVIQRSVLGVQLKWAGVESDTKTVVVAQQPGIRLHSNKHKFKQL